MTTRKSLRRFIALFLLFALLLSLNLFGGIPTAFADDSGTCGKYVDNLTWTFRDGTLTISGKGEMADYTFEDPAPWDDLKLYSIRISDGVTAIGDYAFPNCRKLADITLPEGVTSLGDSAFYGCWELETVTLPSSLSTVGVNPFAYCSKLAEFSVSPDNPVLAVIDGALYSLPDHRLISCIRGREYETFTVPEGITEIGENACSSCTNIFGVSLPDSLTSIGYNAFCGCSNLEKIQLPDGLLSIGDYAFSNCVSLIDLTLPGSLTAIGDYTFFSCLQLHSVTLEEGITSIGDSAFSFCEELTDVRLPDSLTSIGPFAFSLSPGLKRITLPDSLISMGMNPFALCFNLEEISVSPKNPALTVIDGVLYSRPDHRLISCPTAKDFGNFTIAEGTQSIDDYAFRGCESLTGITLPDGVTAIGNEVFTLCVNLTDVSLPGSLISLGDGVFNYCCSLKRIDVPDSVSSIGEDALFTYNPVTIVVGRNSFAAQYCEDYGMEYSYSDSANRPQS